MKGFTFYLYNRWFCKNILRTEYTMHQTACNYFVSSVFLVLAPIFLVTWSIIAAGFAVEFAGIIDSNDFIFIPMVTILMEIYGNYYGSLFKFIPFFLLLFVPLVVGLSIGFVLFFVVGFISFIAPFVVSLAIGSIPFVIVGLVTYFLLKDKLSLSSILSKGKDIALSSKGAVFSWLKSSLCFSRSLAAKLCKPMDFSRYD